MLQLNGVRAIYNVRFSKILILALLGTISCPPASFAAKEALDAAVNFGAVTKIGDQIEKDPQSPIAKLVKKAVDESDCERKVVLPETQPALKAGDAEVLPFKIEISGPGCPITYLAELKGIQKPDGFDAEFSMSYESQSPEALKLYDISKSTTQGKISAKSVQTATGGGFEFELQFNGKGISQSNGAFEMNSSTKGNLSISMGGSSGPGAPPASSVGGVTLPAIDLSGRMEETLVFQLAQSKGELKSVSVVSGLGQTTTFTIDGQSVSEADYKKYRDLIQLPSISQVGPGGPEEKLMDCSVRIFDARALSLNQAESAIASKTPILAPLVKESSYCGGATNISIDQFSTPPKTPGAAVANWQIQATYSSRPNQGFNQVTLELCEVSPSSASSGPMCTKSDRSFLMDEEAAYADTALDFTIVTQCKPVVSCSGTP